MEALIRKKLKEIEQREGCRILLAVESGSRAWGFASPDSDYDVRFIYVRPKESYLRLDRVRDVIEVPISDDLDINGWDIDKTLKLLHKSNPTVFEWFSSPIIYRTSEFAERFKPIMRKYFSSKSSLWHYLPASIPSRPKPNGRRRPNSRYWCNLTIFIIWRKQSFSKHDKYGNTSKYKSLSK